MIGFSIRISCWVYCFCYRLLLPCQLYPCHNLLYHYQWSLSARFYTHSLEWKKDLLSEASTKRWGNICYVIIECVGLPESVVMHALGSETTTTLMLCYLCEDRGSRRRGRIYILTLEWEMETYSLDARSFEISPKLHHIAWFLFY